MTSDARIKQHYHFEEFDDLMRRVAETIYPSTHPERQSIEKLMSERRFCPAGNTLLAGDRSIRPNCCVLPTVTDENEAELTKRAIRLWKHHTGIGFDLSGCSNPVETLLRLMKAHATISFQDRCQRGNMAVLNATHPRILDLIRAKSDPILCRLLQRANISVSFDSRTSTFQQMMDVAQQQQSGVLWEAAKGAWTCGCPGIIYTDRFQNTIEEQMVSRMYPEMELVRSTVPCGELGLRPNESCNLGAVNLAARGHYGTDGRRLNEEKLRETVRGGIRFLDAVVDKLEIDDMEIMKRTLQLRRLGLGVTGFAEALENCGLEYDSLEAREYAKWIGQIITEEARNTSEILAKQVGEYAAGSQRRNCTVTCAQPTGNITLLLGNRGFGIEPYFHQAKDIHWKDHVKMLQAWQSVLENAVSKTVNMEETVSIQDVLDVFSSAFESQVIKCITIYRNHTREDQPLCLTC